MAEYIKLTDYETGKAVYIKKDDAPTEICELNGYGQDDREYVPDRTRITTKAHIYLVSEKPEEIISQFN